MYDNITIKYEDTDFIIGANPINAYRAVWLLKQKLRKNGEDEYIYAFLANAYHTLFKKSIAFKYALKSIKLNPEYAYPYFIAGLILFDTKKYKKAEKYLLKSLELAGEDYYFAVSQLFLVYDALGDYKKKYFYFQKLSGLDCDYPDLIEYKILMDFSYKPIFSSRFPELFRSYKKYKKFPTLLILFVVVCSCLFTIIRLIFGANVCFNCACELTSAGATEEAVALFLSGAEKYKKRQNEFYIAALNVYFDLNDYKNCIDVANKILIKDKNSYAYICKARCYSELKDFEKAIAMCEKADELQPGEAKEIKVRSLIELDRKKEAISYINSLILKNPTLENFKVKGDLFCLISDYEEAQKAYEKAAEIDKNSEEILYRLAKCLYFKGKNKEALKIINRALIQKKDFYNYELKGHILSALNKIKEAEECYRESELYK